MKKLLNYFVITTTFCLLHLNVISQTNTHKYKIGDTINDFKLLNTENVFKSLSDYKNQKGIIIIFTCNHCPYSVAYEDRLKKLHQKYSVLGFPIVAINSNDAKTYPIDSYENMIERSQEKNFTFDYLHDETQEVAKQFGATTTPHVYLVSNHYPSFIIEYIGAIDDNAFEEDFVKKHFLTDALNQLLINKPIVVTNTKAIGCSIKWKK